MYETDAVKAAHQVFGRERERKRERVCDITLRIDLETLQKEDVANEFFGAERERKERVCMCACVCVT